MSFKTRINANGGNAPACSPRGEAAGRPGRNYREWGERGFSLIEVFLVAGLLSVVLLTIFSVYSGGIKIWNMAQQFWVVQDRQFILSFEKVKKDIKGYIRDFDEEEMLFEGDRKEFSFPSLSGLEIIKVIYKFDKNSKAVVKQKVKFTDSLKEKMKENITALFPAEGCEFEYLLLSPSGLSEPEIDVEGKEGDEGLKADAGEWVSSFSEEDEGIPEAIRFKMRKNGKEVVKHVFIPK